MATTQSINFGFPLTQVQKDQLAVMLGVTGEEITFQDEKASFELGPDSVVPQLKQLAEKANFPRNGSARLSLGLPGMSWAAGAILAMSSGFLGRQPEIFRSVQGDDKSFHVHEVIDLQKHRDDNRSSRYGNENGLNVDTTVVVNFSHPFTEQSLQWLGDKLGETTVLNIATQVDPKGRFDEAAVELVNAAGLSPKQWQKTGSVVVNLPALAPLAAAVATEIHARMGEFPKVLRVDRQADGSFLAVEIIDLQALRIWAKDFDLEAKRAETAAAVKHFLGNVEVNGSLEGNTLTLSVGGNTYEFEILSAVKK